MQTNEREDEPTTEFQFLVHDSVEPVQETPEPIVHEPVPQPTTKDLVFIHVMLKSIRGGRWGYGNERVDNLVNHGLSEEAAEIFVCEADRVK